MERLSFNKEIGKWQHVVLLKCYRSTPMTKRQKNFTQRQIFVIVATAARDEDLYYQGRASIMVGDESRK